MLADPAVYPETKGVSLELIGQLFGEGDLIDANEGREADRKRCR